MTVKSLRKSCNCHACKERREADFWAIINANFDRKALMVEDIAEYGEDE